MPMHDWNLVDAGTFHAFHLAWIGELQKSLNGGGLPKGYYALAEQYAGGAHPGCPRPARIGPPHGPVPRTERWRCRHDDEDPAEGR